MQDFLAPILTKIALGLLEAVAVQLLWKLWSDHARSHRAAVHACG
jgi:hypothetical protein